MFAVFGIRGGGRGGSCSGSGVSGVHICGGRNRGGEFLVLGNKCEHFARAGKKIKQIEVVV
jgi:hypothetical protein